MRIAFVSDAYVPVPTGVAVSLQTLKISLEKMGHTVYIFAPDYFGFKDSDPLVARLPAVFELGKKYSPRIWPVVKAKKAQIKKLKLDIVHSHFFFKDFLFAKKLADLAGVPLINTVYRLFPEQVKFERKFLQFSQTKKEKALQKSLHYLNLCDGIVALSNATKSYLKDFSVHTPIEVIPVGIFPKDFAGFPPQAVRKKFAIPDGRKIILYVGRIEDDKNLKFLLKSFKRVWQAIDDVHLLIVGGGSRLNYFRQMASLLPYNNFITFTGYLPKSYVNKIYATCDVLAYPPQLDCEPLVVLESLAAGTPVVALKGLGAQDFIVENVDGFVTGADDNEFSDRIIELLRRDNMRLEFSQNARREALAFRSSNLSEDLVRYYDQIIEQSGNKII